MTESRVIAALSVLCAVLVGLLVWTWTGKSAAEQRAAVADSVGAVHAERAEGLGSELGRQLQVVANLEAALADSGEVWTGRLAQADTTLIESAQRAADVNEALSARLDSIGQVLLDSLNTEHAAQMAAERVRTATESARADAQTMRADSLTAALWTAVERGDEWQASAESYRIASETKDAVIRSLKIQRNVGGVTTLAALAALAVLVVR